MINIPQPSEVVAEAFGKKVSLVLSYREEVMHQISQRLPKDLQGPLYGGSTRAGDAERVRLINGLPVSLLLSKHWDQLEELRQVAELQDVELSTDEKASLAVLKQVIENLGEEIQLTRVNLLRLFEIMQQLYGEQAVDDSREASLRTMSIVIVQAIRGALERMGILENESFVVIPKEIEGRVLEISEYIRERKAILLSLPRYIDTLVHELRMEDLFPSLEHTVIWQVVADLMHSIGYAVNMSIVPPPVRQSQHGRASDQRHHRRAYTNEGPKAGRNAPCPCGSGRKYKKCCLRKADEFDAMFN